MRMDASILSQFPKASFWDVDPTLLDVKEDKDFIIPRALFMTTPQTFYADISKLEHIYSRNQIVHALKTTKERISNKVCHMVAEHYHIQGFSRFSR